MDKNYPKRRKDKYNPYTICKRDGRYYLAFSDGQGAWHELEITADLYGALDQFELDDLAALNEWDRHIEHLEQTEQAINRRAVHYPESVEDTVLQNLEYEQLHKAIDGMNRALAVSINLRCPRTIGQPAAHIVEAGEVSAAET